MTSSSGGGQDTKYLLWLRPFFNVWCTWNDLTWLRTEHMRLSFFHFSMTRAVMSTKDRVFL
jgi:hypothetical protein